MIIPVIIMILGMFILYGGAKIFIRVKKTVDNMSSVCKAKVVNVEIWDFTNDHGYKMTYEANLNGKRVFFKDKIAGNVRIRKGKIVEIKYDPKNLKNFSLLHKDSRFTLPMAILFMGIVVIFIGITMLISVI